MEMKVTNKRIEVRDDGVSVDKTLEEMGDQGFCFFANLTCEMIHDLKPITKICIEAAGGDDCPVSQRL